jgi:hypothetical protein
MSFINANRQSWQEWIATLPWNPKHAQQSANIALSKANWIGLTRDQSIEAVLKLPAASYLRDNRFILLAAWERITRQINGEDILSLELEPTLQMTA